MSEERMCLLLDCRSSPVAKAFLIGPEQAERLRVRVPDRRAGEVAELEIVQLLGIEDDCMLKCSVVERRGEELVLERLEVLDAGVRSNLRIPVSFESFLYPLYEKGRGREAIESVDLSCGGIAFYAPQGHEVGEVMEIVIPITEQPLIVRGRILKRNDLKNGRSLYAAKFVELCHDEEKMIRRAVFGVQIRADRTAL